MSLNLDEFLSAYKKLEFQARTSNNQMRTLRNLFSQIKDLYGSFSNSLRQLGESFHKDIYQDDNNDEKVFPYYQYLGNQLLKISETHKEFSNDVASIILIPYTEFSNNIETTTRTDLNNLAKVGFFPLNSNDYLVTNKLGWYNSVAKKVPGRVSSFGEYYKQARVAEKLQDNFNKVFEEKTEDQLKRAQDKLLKSKKEAQEAKDLYKKQIDSANQFWKALYSSFPKQFNLYDENEENRNYFTQNTITNLIKFFNNFYLKGKTELNQNFDEKLKEFNDKIKAKQSEENKVGSFESLTSPNLLETIQRQPLEIFLSYEAKKKTDELEIIKEIRKFIEKEEYTVIYGASNELDLQFIMNYVKNFLPKNQALDSSTPTLLSSDLNLSTSSVESSKEKVDPRIKLPLSEEDEKRFKEILSNPANRKFLFETLNKQRDLIQNSSQIRLSSKRFNILKECLTNIIKDLFKENDYETLVFFLPLANKYCALKNLRLEYLYHSFRNQNHWESIATWSELVNVLFQKKFAAEDLKQKKFEEIDQAQLSSPLMNKIWKLGFKKISSAFDGPKMKSNVSEKDIYSLVLKDICLYLTRLTRNSSVANEILINLAKEHGFGKDEIKQFLSLYQRHRDSMIHEKIYDHKDFKRATNQPKWDKFYPIYLALDFLDPNDLLRLLELNKGTRQLFKKKVYRTLFYNFGEDLTKAQRLKLWCNILEINQLGVDFQEINEKHVKSMILQPSDRDDVIKMDVARSFTSHKTFQPEMLENLLRGYSHLNKELTYCQGMNYVMGFCYINLQDPNITFKCFVRLMEWHVKPIFEREFKVLKQYFFKFNRIIDLYLPDLAEHFKTEKIETSFFMPSWFITIFSNNFQYTKRSKFLEKIWDFFILDGFKVVFKTALLILMEFKSKFLQLKFDAILRFLRDIGKDEIFTNKIYFDIIEGKITESESAQAFTFVKNFGNLMKNLSVTKELLNVLDEDFETFEFQLPKLANMSF